MSRSWDDDPRMRRIRRDDYDDYGTNPERSGAVTAIGIVGIVYGGILALFGLCFLFCGLVTFNAPQPFFGTQTPALFILFAVTVLGVSISHIFGGIFLIQRKNAARIFMLVLAGIDFILGILNIASMIFFFSQPQGFGRNGDGMVMMVLQVFSLLVNWGFSTFAFIVLLNGRNAEEFT